MLKKVSILCLILVSGCLDNNIHQIQNINPPIVSSSNIVINTKPEPNPFDKNNLEMYSEDNYYGTKSYCEALEQDKLVNIKLLYPTDIAVAEDGKAVYITSIDCHLHNSNIPIECKYQNDNGTIKRKFIYKIDKNKKLSILKINNIPVNSCKLQSEIEIDNSDNLYSVSNNEIYKISQLNNNLEKIYPDLLKKNNFTYDGYETYPFKLYISNTNILYFLSGFVPKYDEDPITNEFSLDSYNLNTGEVKLSISGGKGILNSGGIGPIDENVFSIYNDNKYISFYESNKQINYETLSFLIKTKTFVSSIFNSKGEMFASDPKTHSIYKIIPNESIELFAGNGKEGKAGFKDGRGSEAEFNIPTGLSFDGQDNLYVADTGNNAIRKITPDGTVTTFYAEK